MRTMVLPATTPAGEAVAACAAAGAEAVVIVGKDPGVLVATLGGAGLRVATFTGPPDDPALAEMAAELFGPDAELLNLRQ
jgi:hypothetical protein